MKSFVHQLWQIAVVLALPFIAFGQPQPVSLVSNVLLEPIIYRAGPPFGEGSHAYFTFEVGPGVTNEFLNARLIEPVTGEVFWIVENVPLPVVYEPMVISCVVNVEGLPLSHSVVQCAYTTGDFQEEENFMAEIILSLLPQPVIFHVPSGSDDPAVSALIPSVPAAVKPKRVKTKMEQKLRGDDMPNIDLDKKTDRTDTMACGPAAAGNSIQWLIKQHPELAGETSSLRSKVDSLKKYMNRSDKKGVRFDSMVVGKLTLIDALKLPIKVKYKTMHDSGHPKDDLASTKPPHHTPENKGPQQHPDFAWLKSEIDEGEDVEVQVGWYGPPGKDGKRDRAGGHWMVAEGYITAGNIKGVYVKHDTDQNAKGGARLEYFKWDTLPGGIPFLSGLKDEKGNIAIVESVVSESYDPTVTFDDPMSTAPSPWDGMDLTGAFMKPGYIFEVPVIRSSPWVPVGAGIIGAGLLTYIVTQDDDPQDCSFAASAQVLNSLCGESNGSASVSTTPAGDYDFIWSTGSTAPDIQNLSPGSYMVTVTLRGTSCSTILTTTVMNINPDYVANISSVPANCGSSDGSASLSITPPADYVITWSNGGTGNIQSGLQAGNYMVTVSLGSSCTETYSLTIDEQPADFNLTIVTTPAQCGMSDGTATVSIDLPGSYQVMWSNGATGMEVNGLHAGDYTVTVTADGTSCQKSDMVSVDELPADINISFNVTPSACGTSDGEVTAVVDPPGSYIFQWSNGSTGSGISNAASGEYQLTVTLAGSDCSATSSVMVGELPPDFTLSFTTISAGCGVSDGSATVMADPEGSYDYIWSDGNTTPTIQDVAAGEYQVTVTRTGTTCAISGSVVIDQLAADFIADIMTTPGNCLGEGAEITITTQTHAAGPMEINAAGPDGLHVVTAPAGVTLLSTFFTILPGSWQITVRDAGISAACTEETMVNVTNNTVLTTIDDFFETMTDQSISGNVLANDNGIDLFIISHTLPSGGTLILDPDGNFIFTPPPGASGQYTFQYTAGDACDSSSSATVTINVLSAGCPFETTFDITPSACGLMTGAIMSSLTPPGMYTFLWSNGQTTQDLVDVGDGFYSVTVTSMELNCNKTYTVEVSEIPVVYINGLTSSPGNCTGEGEITITVTTPGDGPLVLTVTGPEGTQQVILPPGTHFLSSSMNIPSGDYSINVYDQDAGAQCSETASINVSDNTPLIDANDDFYETTAGTPVIGNLLDNDTGLDIVLTEVSQITGGVVDFSSIGDFTFTPDPGFSGLASFVYTVTDACGTTATAFVEIDVIMCDFTAGFTNSNASCGLEDGSSTVSITPEGPYIYQWSNGDTGSSVSGLPAGVYSVTVEHAILGCALTFVTQVGEDPPMYVTNMEIIQPVCPMGGDIIFEVSAPGNGFFEITVLHPNGAEEFIVSEGVVMLSEFISIVDGDYLISVVYEDAGPACVEEFEATIEGTSMLEITLEGVIPPSEPTAMDGAIIVAVTSQTVPPYTIYLNGSEWGLALEPFFVIEGVGSGPHTVQIEDLNGCFSNSLNIVIPLAEPLQIMSGYSIMTFAPSLNHGIEGASDNPHPGMVSSVNLSFKYRTMGARHESRFFLFDAGTATAMRYDQMMTCGTVMIKNFQVEYQGGLSMELLRHGTMRPYWIVQGNLIKSMADLFEISCMVSFRGWKRPEIPVLELGIKRPFPVRLKKD